MKRTASQNFTKKVKYNNNYNQYYNNTINNKKNLHHTKRHKKRLRQKKFLKIKRICILLLFLTIITAAIMHIKIQKKQSVSNQSISINTTWSTFDNTGENDNDFLNKDIAGNQIASLSVRQLYDLGIPEKLIELYEKNEDARQFVTDYPKKKNMTYKIDLNEYKNCTDVPLLMQWDERWGYEFYSGDLFGLTGCGPTCLSMAAIYLTKNTEYTPKYIKNFSEEWGYSVEGSGSAWTLISQGAKKLGMNVKELPLSEEKMIESLSDNGIIIAVLGPGDFTESGHFIVIKSYDNGFIINDPNSYYNSEKKWSYERLKGQIKNLWKLSV